MIPYSIYSPKRPKANPTSSGNTIEKTYVKAYRNGVPYLKETGEIDIQAKIQSACPPSINELVRRAALGDDTVFKANKGFYDDVSDIGDLGNVFLQAKQLNNITTQIQNSRAKKRANIANNAQVTNTENNTKETTKNES